MNKCFFMFIFAVSLTSVIFLSGCKEDAFVQEQTIDNNTDKPVIQKINLTKDNKPIMRLKSELQLALGSGGINPETYTEIDKKIKEFESEGYEKNLTDELRTMLSQLNIGGQNSEAAKNETIVEIINKTESDIIRWSYMEGKWTPNSKPPECPEALVLQAPVDLDLVTSILYPGQKRSGDFKPHGGFRTDGNNDPVEVRAPLSGYISSAAKFYDQFGVHYMFDIQHPCGIMYRLGHLGAVPKKLEAIFDDIPTGEYGDSKTYEVKPVFIELGETIATDTQHGSGFDWGVYDLRKENDASKDPMFREAHKDEPYQAYHAICWLNYLSADEQIIVKNLPAADGVSGKTSDYC